MYHYLLPHTSLLAIRARDARGAISIMALLYYSGLSEFSRPVFFPPFELSLPDRFLVLWRSFFSFVLFAASGLTSFPVRHPFWGLGGEG